MELLKSLDKNTKIINISNCGLKGVLDLEDFKNLEELYCSNNEITEIINIPENIKYVNEYIYNNENYQYILVTKRIHNNNILYYPIIKTNYLEYNKNIEESYTIYGTYRNKKMKVDKWEHKYGNKDDIFRIVDVRNVNIIKRGDQRNDITGKAATSYNLSELKNIATVLNVNVSDTHEKRDLIELIRRNLEESNRILK